MSILLHAIACTVFLGIGIILGAILAVFLVSQGTITITRSGKPVKGA